MKCVRLGAVALLVLVFPGCRVADPSGPIPRIRVHAALEPEGDPGGYGLLVVRTPTRAFWDGGIAYHPHTGYDILDAHGSWIRHVSNHVHPNDEEPTVVRLRPGDYILRPVGARVELLVTVKSGREVRIDWSEVERQMARGEAVGQGLR